MINRYNTGPQSFESISLQKSGGGRGFTTNKYKKNAKKILSINLNV